MADIDMTDAPSGSAAPAKKALGKGKTGASEGGPDGKKRFEVKKVKHYQFLGYGSIADENIVERSCFVGVGYRR